jgi:hypothetical protein
MHVFSPWIGGLLPENANLRIGERFFAGKWPQNAELGLAFPGDLKQELQKKGSSSESVGRRFKIERERTG